MTRYFDVLALSERSNAEILWSRKVGKKEYLVHNAKAAFEDLYTWKNPDLLSVSE